MTLFGLFFALKALCDEIELLAQKTPRGIAANMFPTSICSALLMKCVPGGNRVSFSPLFCSKCSFFL